MDFQGILSISKNDQRGGQNPNLPLKCPFEETNQLYDKIIPGHNWGMKLLIGGFTLGLKSSQKRERQNIKRRTQNRSYKSRARTLVKKAFLAIEEQNLESARETTHAAVEALDKAAAKGAIHKNNAARRKSRLMTRLASLDKGA
jgi:small subunit ribosomal protein S20